MQVQMLQIFFTLKELHPASVSLTKYICVTAVGFAPLNELPVCTGAGLGHPQPWRYFSTWNRFNEYI